MGWKSAVLGVLLSILATYVIFKLTETNVTWETLKHLNYPYIFLAFLFQVFFWIFWALRLKRISHYMGYRIPYLFSLKVTLSSMFLAAITPSSAGGEPLRIKMVSDNGIPIGSSTFIVLTERILDSIFFATALPIFLIITGFSTALGFKVAFIFLLLILCFVYILYLILKNEENTRRFSKILAKLIRKKNFEKKIESELKNFRLGTLQLISSPVKLVHLFSLTAVMWSVGFMIPSLILISMNSDPQFLLSYTSQLIIVIISLIPITPGSSGLVEATMAYFYSNFIPISLLGSLIAIWRFITYHMNIIFGLIALNYSALKRVMEK
uniref:Flippase-like domain-containing protein n=1 Tax=Archaeoglobus fulgidus TaxID=2234 RepID=A0A7J2THJ8_ARCFL